MNQPFYSSLVVEHIIPNGQRFAFIRWHNSLARSARRQIGFLRVDLCPALKCKNNVIKWYSIVHFDTPEHLSGWIESDERQQLLASGQEIFCSYRFKSFTTGLEGWFSKATGTERTGLGAPTWKQILVVVMGLYPVLMLQSKLFKMIGVMHDWPPATAMLVNNLITSSMLSLVVMPFVTGRLRFWLKPAYVDTDIKNDLFGLGIAVVILTGMVIIFNQF